MKIGLGRGACFCRSLRH